jgi:hypothetical protein
LRDELSSARHRLIDIENEFLNSKQQIIQITEENNRLQTDVSYIGFFLSFFLG